MDYDERSIRTFLRGYPGQFVSPRIISRRLGGKRRYHQDPLWAVPILSRMVDKGVIETDAQGHFRLRRADQVDGRKRTWISPQVRSILERSSADFTHVIAVDEEAEELT